MLFEYFWNINIYILSKKSLEYMIILCLQR